LTREDDQVSALRISKSSVEQRGRRDEWRRECAEQIGVQRKQLDAGYNEEKKRELGNIKKMAPTTKKKKENEVQKNNGQCILGLPEKKVPSF